MTTLIEVKTKIELLAKFYRKEYAKLVSEIGIGNSTKGYDGDLRRLYDRAGAFDTALGIIANIENGMLDEDIETARASVIAPGSWTCPECETLNPPEATVCSCVFARNPY